MSVGLRVVHDLMEREVDEVVGPKHKQNPDRTAKRHDRERGFMTLGGRRVEVERPRVRTVDDEHELPARTYEYFADRDPLTRAVMDRVLAGVSTRKFAQVGEPVGEDVEDAGGGTLADPAAELDALAIVVTRAGLGTLNASALTCEAPAVRGVECLGLVIGAWPAPPDLAATCNVDDLPTYTGRSVLGRLPEGAGRLAPDAFIEVARAGLDAELHRLAA